jgi:allophanate hydrolase
MLHWSQGLFGFVANLQPVLDLLHPLSFNGVPSAETPPQTPPEWDGDVRISSLQAAYRSGLSPVNVIESLYKNIESYETINPGSWIYKVPKETVLAAAQELVARYPDKKALPPLYGVPFTVKDSIDVGGLPTTTACPPLTHIAAVDAPIYTAVLREGALFLGKANLDQLATGLTGQRSPYGACSSALHKTFISGGSSSGSAVQVGAHLVSFSLATDTAGSGRVPSSFNGVVGYKPTRGTVPFVGITPACLRLDCVAVIAGTVQDARTVWQIIEEFDPRDPYAKTLETRYHTRMVNSIGPQATQFRFGIPPPEALAACSPPYKRLFAETVAKLQKLGGKLQPIDWHPFQAAGDILYDGSFVCERLASLPDLPGSDGTEPSLWLANNTPNLHPVIVELFGAVLDRKTSPADVYRDLQAQVRYTAKVHNDVFTQEARGVDVVVVPTAPTHWTMDEVKADPIKKNSILGTFTHCGNVLDLCGVATPAAKFPASELKDGEEGTLPFGVTFLGGSQTDAEVLEIAKRFEEFVREEGSI